MRYSQKPLERYSILPDGCWQWNGYIDRNGYGMAWIEGKHRLAHRLFYAEYVGDLINGLTIDHLCKNRSCVNPDHLQQVTQSVNAKRGKKDNFNPICPQGHVKDKKIIDRGYETMICSTCKRMRQQKYADANRDKVRERTRIAERKRRERRKGLSP